MEHDRIMDRSTVSRGLYPGTQAVSPSEEDRHPWRARDDQTYEVPFLRIWDHNSGSQPDEDHCMKSREPEMHLDTYTKRKNSLAKHLDYKDRTPGPYISFTTNPAEIQDQVMKGHGKDRGSHTLTVVDPNRRISKGLPILDVRSEMESYGIPDPCGRCNQYHLDEYVCLWQVTEAEIVRHWSWDYLAQNENWYEDIVMPAFRKFTERHRVSPTEEAPVELLTGFNELSGRFAMFAWVFAEANQFLKLDMMIPITRTQAVRTEINAITLTMKKTQTLRTEMVHASKM